MNYIKRILRLYENRSENAFSNYEIALFKSINKNKDKFNKKDDYILFITRFLSATGRDKFDARYLYLLYTSNYREDGQYEEIKKGSQVIPGFLEKQRTTSNTNASSFVRNKMPFKGSNLAGKWEKDRFGEPQYVVLSYGWYPILIFKEEKWFEVTDRYSSSTSRQISNTRIYGNSTLLSADEMQSLRQGLELVEIENAQKHKLFADLKKMLMSKPFQFAKVFLPQIGDTPSADFKIKFALNFIDKFGSDTILDIDILDIAMVNEQGQIIMRYSSNMLNNENKEAIKSALKNWVNVKLDPNLRNISDFRMDIEFKI